LSSEVLETQADKIMMKFDGHSSVGFPAPSGHAYQIQPLCPVNLGMGVLFERIV
jgi:hypothetical protein